MQSHFVTKKHTVTTHDEEKLGVALGWGQPGLPVALGWGASACILALGSQAPLPPQNSLDRDIGHLDMIDIRYS